MSEVVEKIQRTSIRTLRTLVQQSLMDVERQVVDQIGEFLGLSESRDEMLSSFVVNMNYYFDELLDKETTREGIVYDFENLTLVREEEFDIMLVLEGLVKTAREQHLSNFMSFHTRFSSVLPRKRIDALNNPLDAEQIANAFQDALRPLELDVQNTLTVYRAFESSVLNHLDEVYKEADKLLIEGGVIPDLDIEKHQKQLRAQSAAERSRASPTKRRQDLGGTFHTVEEDNLHVDIDLDLDLGLAEENFSNLEPAAPGEAGATVENTNTFSMMQNLMHGNSPAAPTSGGMAGAGGSSQEGGFIIPEGHVLVPASQVQQYMVPASMIPGGDNSPSQAGMMQPFQPSGDQQVQLVDQAKLMEILSNIQHTLGTQLTSAGSRTPSDGEEADSVNISDSLGELLNADKDDGVINAIDRESSDVINLVTMLYEAIWDDDSVPIPIKELIGRTQITVIKVALSDNTFFNREDHPLRAILNEFAMAGIGWTEVESLEEDPLYKKIRELVEKILLGYDGDVSFFDDLVKEFRKFIVREAAKSRQLEQSIITKKEGQDRLDDINELVTQKIDERILGRELDPFVRDLLEQPFHKFMELLVLKEGPGSSAWKQAINTIDVLLWSVQPHEQKGDRDRLETVNPRLIKNLQKAFRIASVDPEVVKTLISNLQNIQRGSFPEEEEEEATITGSEPLLSDDASSTDQPPDATDDPGTPIFMDLGTEAEKEPNPYLVQVECMTVGTWVEFIGEDEQTTRCKLEAKINAIDKFIFVNRQGVKVTEKTTIGLAKELEEETLRVISDGLLFSRALESVVSTLRENQIEQHTGGAYQPTA